MENKNEKPTAISIIYVLKILQDYSDEKHLLTYNDIITYLYKQYSITVDRKTVIRNINNLTLAGYGIETKRRGSYLVKRDFENSELRLLIDSVIFSKHISEADAKNLIEKLQRFGSEDFRKKSNSSKYYATQTFHSQSQDLFDIIDKITEAINPSRPRQIMFTHNKYILDNNQQVQLQSMGNNTIINPYYLIPINNYYYLVGNCVNTNDLVPFRLDMISNVKILDSARQDIRETDKNFDYKRYISSHPYMHCGQAESIKLKIFTSCIGEIIDAFGDNFCVDKIEDDKAIISLQANIEDMFDWAMKMGKYVEITYPQELRDEIRECVTAMARKYTQNDDDKFNEAIKYSKNKHEWATFFNIDLTERTNELSKYDYKELRLKNNFISSIDFIKNYKSLKRLFIKKNAIKDFSVLSELLELRDVSLIETRVEDISFLNKLSKITDLTLISNPIKDYSPLYSLNELKYLCIDYQTAITLNLDIIKNNNRGVYIKIENPYIIDRIVKYEYDQIVFVKKIADNLYSKLRINDNKREYSINNVDNPGEYKIGDDYDIYLQIVNKLGYKKVDAEDMGERRIKSQEPFVITKRVLEILEKQIEIGTTSLAQIQRTLKCPFGIAVNIIDWMIENKYIEKQIGHSEYKVIMTKQQFIEKYGQN